MIDRLRDVPIDEPARWYSLVQLLTESGQLDRASTLDPAVPGLTDLRLRLEQAGAGAK